MILSSLPRRTKRGETQYRFRNQWWTLNVPQGGEVLATKRIQGEVHVQWVRFSQKSYGDKQDRWSPRYWVDRK